MSLSVTFVHACINYTPFYLTHGREARVSVDVLVPSQIVCSDLAISHVDFVASLVVSLEIAFSGTRPCGATAHETKTVL